MGSKNDAMGLRNQELMQSYPSYYEDDKIDLLECFVTFYKISPFG